MVYRAAWEFDTKGPSLQTFNWFVRAKLAMGSALQRVSDNAKIACGMHSLFQNQELERMIRDAATGPIMPPNSDASANMVGLLTMGLNPMEAPSLRAEEPEEEPALSGAPVQS